MLLEKVQTSRFGDGSFDIRGGGTGILLSDKFFLLPFCTTSYVFQKKPETNFWKAIHVP